MTTYYLIFQHVKVNSCELLCITSDYYYFRRLCKKYIRDCKDIICKSIDLYSLYEYSKFL